jgi:hypothetical protein
MLNSGGCAVHPDGTLKDVSEIDWDYNPDGEMPASASANSNVVALPDSPPKIHSFFARQAPPATKLAGACHFIHTTHLSTCVINPNNLMNTIGPSSHMPSSTSPAKCKASGLVSSYHTIHKVIAKPSSDGDTVLAMRFAFPPLWRQLMLRRTEVITQVSMRA